jgi:hypothetical protein
MKQQRPKEMSTDSAQKAGPYNMLILSIMYMGDYKDMMLC